MLKFAFGSVVPRVLAAEFSEAPTEAGSVRSMMGPSMLLAAVSQLVVLPPHQFWTMTLRPPSIRGIELEEAGKWGN